LLFWGSDLLTKLRYLARSVLCSTTADRFNCPNCGSSSRTVVDKKYIVTKLCRCTQCNLLFRVPTDNPNRNTIFYETQYHQGFTTNLPSAEELLNFRRTNFSGTEKDFSGYIKILRSLGITSGSRVFDFGCSWGYGSYQFGKSGLDVTAFEVAITRGQYAERELGVRLVNDIEQAIIDPAHHQSYDCFFSAHVLEHIPAPQCAFKYAHQLLKMGGIFVSFTPNGSVACRKAEPSWGKLWGEVHPNFIDDIFLDLCFSNSPRIFGSTPIETARLPDRVEALRVNQLSGMELFFAARKAGNVW
jgi:2-polyprenyl-3-methyl-5-hydroxy-6-metoxy-1,4-benzoquinol methylase